MPESLSAICARATKFQRDGVNYASVYCHVPSQSAVLWIPLNSTQSCGCSKLTNIHSSYTSKCSIYSLPSGFKCFIQRCVQHQNVVHHWRGYKTMHTSWQACLARSHGLSLKNACRTATVRKTLRITSCCQGSLHSNVPVTRRHKLRFFQTQSIWSCSILL